MPKHPWSIVATVGMLLLTAVGLIWGVAIRADDDSPVLPFISIVIGMIATALPGLIAAIKVEQVHEDIKNGVLKDKVKEAIIETVDDKNNDVKGFFHHESGHANGWVVLIAAAVAIVIVAIYATFF